LENRKSGKSGSDEGGENWEGGRKEKWKSGKAENDLGENDE
jgi:hypothetical protein